MYYTIDDAIKGIENNITVYKGRVIWSNLGHELEEAACKPHEYLFGNSYWLNK